MLKKLMGSAFIAGLMLCLNAAAAAPARPDPPTRDPHTPGYVEATELPDGAVPVWKLRHG